MARKTFLCTLGVFLAAAVLCPPIPQALASPRQQDSTIPVAEAARRARAEKKQAPTTSAKVYTNDDVESLKGTVSVVGPDLNAPAAKDSDKSAAAAPPAVPAAPKDEAGWRKSFADARKKLADDAKELDILQREFNLKQEQYYTDPNASLREEYSRDDINKTRAEIDMKKQDVDNDNQAISDLEDQLRKSGGDPGWAREQ